MRKRRLIFLTQYDKTGASSRIRVYQFLPCFQKADFDTKIFPLIKGDSNRFLARLSQSKNPIALGMILSFTALRFVKRYWDVVHAWRADVVVVQKDVLPFGLRSLLYLGQKNIVFDFDDAIWLPNPGAGGYSWLGKAMRLYRKSLLIDILKISKCVIVDNSYLEKFAANYCSNIVVLSAPIDTEQYRVGRKQGTAAKILAWIGSPGTTYLLEGLLPFLEKLHSTIAIEVWNVGGLPLQSNHFQVRNLTWSINQELETLSRADIGLMPLDEQPFNQGRLGYKMIQYLSAGVPVLAADLALNREVIQDGIEGYLYRTNEIDDFIEKAKRLLTNQSLWQQMSQNARQTAQTRYDIQKLFPKFLTSINEVIERKNRSFLERTSR